MKVISGDRRKKGETMAEVLVAALVISLALILLVSMVAASQKMVNLSEHSFQNYYTQRNRLEEMSETGGRGKIGISFSPSAAGETAPFEISLGADLPERNVKVYTANGGVSGGREYTFVRYGL